jgi:hypothetical protein
MHRRVHVRKRGGATCSYPRHNAPLRYLSRMKYPDLQLCTTTEILTNNLPRDAASSWRRVGSKRVVWMDGHAAGPRLSLCHESPGGSSRQVFRNQQSAARTRVPTYARGNAPMLWMHHRHCEVEAVSVDRLHPCQW